MSIGVWAQVAIFLRYGSRDTRRIDFPQVDGLSTRPSVLERHIYGVHVFNMNHFLKKTNLS